MEGFIQLHRQLLDWEWYDDINTKVLFIHLLLKANWKDKEWRGKIIERGSFITSLDNLSKETGLSVRQIRTSIDKLKTTSEITYEGQASYSIIKLNKYNNYQSNDKQNDKLPTNEGQATDKLPTTTNKDNNTNKEKNNISSSNDDEHFKTFWNLYKRKISKKKTEQIFRKIKDKYKVIEGLKKYIEKWEKEKTDIEFIPHPTTWLNQERRNDYIEIISKETPEEIYAKKVEEMKRKAGIIT